LEKEFIHRNDMKISFIGGGNMAAALIGGLANKVTAGNNVHVVDINADALANLANKFGVTTAQAIDATIAQSDLIVLAVKPQQLKDVVLQLRPFVSKQLILSIAAGIRLVDLSRWLGGHNAIVRAMPNTPALIGKGITGLVATTGVTDAQKEMASKIMQTVGETVWLDDEQKIDVVTGVSGSGPAYVFYFIEAMQEAAVALGLTPEQGIALAKATFMGAAELAVKSDEPVSLLRERVTSKGGTTYAGLMSLEQSGVKAAIGAAIKAAADRGQALGEEFGRD
jgi:pyrroline-5-carboxylate reductase